MQGSLSIYLQWSYNSYQWQSRSRLTHTTLRIFKLIRTKLTKAHQLVKNARCVMQCLSRTNGIILCAINFFCGLWNILNRKWLCSAFCALFYNVFQTNKQANRNRWEASYPCGRATHLIRLFLAMCTYRKSQSGVGKQSCSRMSMQIKVITLHGSHCAVICCVIVWNLSLVNLLTSKNDVKCISWAFFKMQLDLWGTCSA